MKNKRIQKPFYVSSERNKAFLDTRIDDVARENNRSASYVMEKILLDALLPSNEEAREIIQNNLYPDLECGGVQKTLAALFRNNCGIYGWDSKHDNFLPVIEYCLYFVSPTATCRGDEPVLRPFLDELKSTIEKIESAIEYCIEEHERVLYESELNFTKNYCNDAVENPSGIIIRRCFEIVRVYWKALSSWSTTYQLLYDAAQLGDFEESAISRNKLYKVIDSISKEWTE